MDLTEISLLAVIAVTFYGNWAQGVSLAVSPEKHYVKIGDNPILTCKTDQKATFLISNPLKWEKVGRDGSKMVIATLANVAEGLTDKYIVNLPPNEGGMTFNLSFKNGTKNEDDGFYQCVIYSGGSVIAEDKTEVIVLKNMDKMTFAIGGTELDTSSSRAEPIYLEEGDYQPICKTMGSNPAADIKMTLNNVEIGVNTEMVSVEDKARTIPPQVWNTEKRVNLKLTPLEKGKILKCTSTVHNDLAMSSEISFQLDVYSVDPEFKCSNTSAVEGDMWVELECHIKLKGIKCSKNENNIFWENGDSGEQYKVSAQGGKDEMYTVFCSDVADEGVKSTLRINTISKKDFMADFFIVYVNQHNTSKRKLAPLSQNYNSATGIQYAFSLLCSSLLAAILL